MLFDIQSFNFAYKLLSNDSLFFKKRQKTNVVWNLAPKDLISALSATLSDLMMDYRKNVLSLPYKFGSYAPANSADPD